MPTPECFEDIGALKARIEILERQRAADKAAIDAFASERARLGGAVWALGFVLSAAIWVAVNGLPAIVKKFVS